MGQSFSSFWQPFLDTADYVVLDGGLATELERRGADLRDPLWSAKVLLENPDLVQQVHFDYLQAGADIITSASYQASFAGLAQRGLDQAQAAKVMVESVRLAQAAREQFWQNPPTGRVRPLVAASIGCFGAFLHDGSEYRGDYGLTKNQLMDWHRPRLEVLAQGGADLLACETIPCLLEGEALVELLGEYPDVPAWLSFSCRDEKHVCHGENLTACFAVASGGENIVAVGINCTAPHLIEGLLGSVAGVTEKPLLVYPNSGESWEKGGWKGKKGENWVHWARRWYQGGAKIIGGCCRTTPGVISEIRGSL